MRESLLLDVPHRQVVFTSPKMLRLFFRYKRGLLSSLSLAAVHALLKYFHTVIGLELMPGMVAVIQTFGEASKEEVAKVFVAKYPELKVYLTQDKAWKERYHQNMFDAVALGILAKRKGK